jgi:hypothetical protein
MTYLPTAEGSLYIFGKNARRRVENIAGSLEAAAAYLESLIALGGSVTLEQDNCDVAVDLVRHPLQKLEEEILIALSDRLLEGRFSKVLNIAEKAGCDRRVCSERLQNLERFGRVKKNGKRGGYAISPAGLAVLQHLRPRKTL